MVTWVLSLPDSVWHPSVVAEALRKRWALAVHVGRAQLAGLNWEVRLAASVDLTLTFSRNKLFFTQLELGG